MMEKNGYIETRVDRSWVSRGLTLYITERPGIRLRSSRRVRRAWR